MADPERRGNGRPLPVRAAVGFGRFWWEFLVGDTPELFVGAVAAVAVAALCCLDHSLRTTGAVVLPVLVAAVLAGSVRKAGRRRG
ncbi:MAG: hypothetical protein ACLQPH_05330 [Acidimicrobiales bacterium]